MAEQPRHLELLNQLYSKTKFNKDDLLLLNEYIEISQIGGHFSYYCFGKKPDYNLFIKLYNENNILKEFVDKKRKDTIEFICSSEQLCEFNNTFLNENDFNNYYDIILKFIVLCIKKNKTLDYKFYKYFEKGIKKEIKGNLKLYVKYFSLLLPYLNEKEELKFLNYFFRYYSDKQDELYNHLIKLPIRETTKNKLQTTIMLNKMKV